MCIRDRPEADGLRDFYKNVVGWTTMDISMGDYNDYCMVSPCLLYTSDAADDLLCVDLGGRRIIKKKTHHHLNPSHSPVLR